LRAALCWTGGAEGAIPLPVVSAQEHSVVRAEAQTLVDQIQQSLGLLRRHL
jgi:hypothetical protein